MRRSMRTRTIAGIGAGVVGALVLAGCATGGDTTAGPATDGPDLSGQTLTVSADWSGAEQENFEQVLAGFEEATGASVTYESLGTDIATVLGQRLEQNSPPDVAVIPQPGLLRQLVEDDALVPLSDATLATSQENFSQDWIDLGSVDGTAYGVWFKGANKSTMWYNADTYATVGMDPEAAAADWQGFLDQLRLATDLGYSGISVGADAGWPLTDWFENVYLRTAGGEMYDQLSNHEIPWTDDSVAEALEVLAELWGDETLMQPGAAQRTFTDTVPAVFGADPEATTLYEGDFMAGVIAENTDAVVGETALFYDFPSINGSAPAVVGGGNVAVAFNDSEAADALMNYLASPEAAEVWVQLGGFTSPNQNVDTSLYPDDTSRQIAEALTSAETFRFDMSDLAPSAFGGTQGQGEWQILIEFLQNPDDIEGTQQALEEAAADAFGN